MASIRQTSFLGGEFSPLLWGRTDLEVYAHGLRRVRNFFITPQGAAISRPGLEFLGFTKNLQPTRLIPFVVSDTEGYVLEMGHLYLRIHKNGERQGSEIPTPWTGDQLQSLTYTQVGRTMFFAQKNNRPRILTLNAGVWELAELTFNVPEFPSSTVAPVWVKQDPDLEPTEKVTARRWSYRVTYLVKATANNVVYETEPYQVQSSTQKPNPANKTDLNNREALPTKLKIAADFPGYIYVNFDALSWPFAAEVLEARIYRGRGDLFGFVGAVQPSATEGTLGGAIFEDDGRNPDTRRQPPKETKPYAPSGFNHPSSVAFHDQRLVFGRAGGADNRVWLSRVNSYLDFDILEPERPAAGSFWMDLALRRAEQVRAVVGADRLLMFTDSSVWSAEGPEGITTAEDLMRLAPQFDIGTTEVQPIVVGNTVLWARSKGVGIRNLFYDWNRRGYDGRDITEIAEHLFRERRIVRLAHSEDPHRLVWTVNEPGHLLSCTYTENAAAWAEHTTGRGLPWDFFSDVCVVPEGEEDAVYVLVHRTPNPGAWSIERFSSKTRGMCLDFAKVHSFSGNPTSILVEGLQHLNGRNDVWATVRGAVKGPYTVTSGTLLVDDIPPAPIGLGSSSLYVGLRYAPELETLDTAMERDKMKVIRKLIWEVNATQGLFTGESFDNMTEWVQRRMGMGSGGVEPSTGRAEVFISSSWNVHGRAVLRQVDPLPITVLGVTREGEVGGR